MGIITQVMKQLNHPITNIISTNTHPILLTFLMVLGKA